MTDTTLALFNLGGGEIILISERGAASPPHAERQVQSLSFAPRSLSAVVDLPGRSISQ
jgi:hypothetical protein